jgi:hypothetical protein
MDVQAAYDGEWVVTIYLIEKDEYEDRYIDSAWTTLEAARQSLESESYKPYGSPEWEAWRKGPGDSYPARIFSVALNS